MEPVLVASGCMVCVCVCIVSLLILEVLQGARCPASYQLLSQLLLLAWDPAWSNMCTSAHSAVQKGNQIGQVDSANSAAYLGTSEFYITMKPGVVLNSCDPSTHEAEARELL